MGAIQKASARTAPVTSDKRPKNAVSPPTQQQHISTENASKPSQSQLFYTCTICTDFSTTDPDASVRHLRTVHRVIELTSNRGMADGTKDALKALAKRKKKNEGLSKTSSSLAPYQTAFQDAKIAFRHLKLFVDVVPISSTLIRASKISGVSKSEGRERCFDCGDYFVGGKDLELHRRKIHGSTETQKCQHCDRRFTWQRDLTRHLRLHGVEMDEEEEEEEQQQQEEETETNNLKDQEQKLTQNEENHEEMEVEEEEEEDLDSSSLTLKSLEEITSIPLTRYDKMLDAYFLRLIMAED